MLNEAMVDGLAQELDGVDACVIIGTRGLTVSEVSELRNRLRAEDYRMRVVKNSLARISFERSAMPGIGTLVEGSSAICWGGDGALSLSKILVDEAKKRRDKLVIHGGYSEGELLDSAGIDALSKAPSRDELLSMTMAAFFGPVSDLAQSMDGLLTEMHGLVSALAEKQEGAGA
jgi:large subunit ribosomal protein L10